MCPKQKISHGFWLKMKITRMLHHFFLSLCEVTLLTSAPGDYDAGGPQSILWKTLPFSLEVSHVKKECHG